MRRKARAGYGVVILDPLYELIGDADIAGRSGNIPGVLRFLTELQVLGLAPIFTAELAGVNAPHSRRGLGGDRKLRYWLECGLFPSWDDARKIATVRFDAVRDGYGLGSVKLHGLGTGRWQFATRQAEKAGETDEPKMGSVDAKRLRHERLQQVLEADQTRSVASLAAEFDCSERTIERDLKALGIDLSRETAYPEGKEPDAQ